MTRRALGVRAAAAMLLVASVALAPRGALAQAPSPSTTVVDGSTTTTPDGDTTTTTTVVEPSSLVAVEPVRSPRPEGLVRVQATAVSPPAVVRKVTVRYVDGPEGCPVPTEAVTAVAWSAPDSDPADGELPDDPDGGDPTPDEGTEGLYVVPAPLGCNGRYRAHVTVELRHEGSTVEAEVADLRFPVEAPPPPPVDVVAQAGEDRTVTITWGRPAFSDGAEPRDFLGYRVERISAAGATTVVVDRHSDLHTSEVLDPRLAGTFRYVVVALRPGAEPGTVVRSAGAEADEVDVAAVPTAGRGGVNTNTGRRSRTPPTLPRVARTTLPDEGFEGVLPYGEEEEEAHAPLDAVSLYGEDEEDASGLLVPTAVGLVLIVWASHVAYLVRRARLADVEAAALVRAQAAAPASTRPLGGPPAPADLASAPRVAARAFPSRGAATSTGAVQTGVGALPGAPVHAAPTPSPTASGTSAVGVVEPFDDLAPWSARGGGQHRPDPAWTGPWPTSGSSAPGRGAPASPDRSPAAEWSTAPDWTAAPDWTGAADPVPVAGADRAPSGPGGPRRPSGSAAPRPQSPGRPRSSSPTGKPGWASR